MVRLLVMRHAKSDWSCAGGGDHERPLNARGQRAAATMGRYLAAAGYVPDLVLASTAVRAWTTVQLAVASGGWKSEVVPEPGIYEAGVAQVLSLLRERAELPDCVMVAGHEPTCSSLVAKLTGARVRFPTAAVAVVDSDAAWSEVGAAWGTLRSFVLPRDLDAIWGGDRASP